MRNKVKQMTVTNSDRADDSLAPEYKTLIKRHRAPGGGRHLNKPNYNAEEILQSHMAMAVSAYQTLSDGKHPSLATIAEKLELNPIKVRKLLITAGVYKSETAGYVQETFKRYSVKKPYKDALLATAAELKLSRASVTSYLPYEKIVYMKRDCDMQEISTNAERMRLYRDRKAAVEKLHKAMDAGEEVEERLWDCVVAFQAFPFNTASGLPFQYRLKQGRHGEYTKELWVSRMENGKPLVWSSVWIAFQKAAEMAGEIERPKAIGNIRGISYIYPILWRLRVIEVPVVIAEKWKKTQTKKDGAKTP